MKFEAPRGTHDILPSEQPRWRRVKEEAERLCALYGYRRIDTPVFEDTELFLRTSGEGSDVVQKEMYVFEDRGGRSLTLRPEATAPIARAYIEHGLHREPQPQKLYTIGTMYRYAAPQRGRYREHWQLSVEALGSDDPALDAEIIALYDTLLRNLGVRDYRLEINTIGDRECRPQYVQELTDWLKNNDHLLDSEARQKRDTSPLRVFDTKNETVRAALAGAPRIDAYLCDACREHYSSVWKYLNAYGVDYTPNERLVRGLDYYTRTTWEFVGPGEGAQSTISGGGRYDYLVEEIGGPATPGVGLGAGIERLLLAAGDALGVEAPHVDVFFALDEGAPRERVLALIAELRKSGVSTETDYVGRSLKGQLTQAGRAGAETTVVVGADGATIRRQGAEDETISLDALPARLTS